MQIYAFPPSPRARKVLAVAEQLKLPYELKLLDLFKGEQRRPEYLKLNPNGRMPTLVDGDFVLWESNAIIQYLASKNGGLWAADERGRIDIQRWLYWDLAHWDSSWAILLFEYFIKQAANLGTPDAAKVKDGEERFQRSAQVLEGQLGTRPWICGQVPTVADFALAAPMMYTETCRIPLEQYPNLSAWFRRVQQLEGWKKTELKS